MRSVQLQAKELDDYRDVAGEGALEALRSAAAPLEGKRILHINSTSFGGGVAEMLASLVPLTRDLGMDAHWSVIEGDEEFFWITKAIHNGLHGGDVAISAEMRKYYYEINERNAEHLEDGWDFVVVHDPQPLPLVQYASIDGKWIWRCHVDPSGAIPACVGLLAKFLPRYEAGIFSLSNYFMEALGCRNPVVIRPSIDPLSDKNRPMEPEEIDVIAYRYGVDPAKPTISTVARFDPWKDPLGVIDIYRTIKGGSGNRPSSRLLDFYRGIRGKIPRTQLLLISSMAHDDPEGWEHYERALRKAGEDPDIFFLTNLRGVGGAEVNAFQRLSHVALLRSIREGFGLTVSESLWKGVPVVGSNTGGIPLQILDGSTGYLVRDSDAASDRLVALLRNEDLRARLGAAGQAHVRRNFLITRQIQDYIALFTGLSGTSGASA
ncbi:MAG: glycosyltransferase [Thermoplasmata archaeon]